MTEKVTRILRSRWLFDGISAEPLADAEVHVEGPTIRYVGPSSEAPARDTSVEVIDLGNRTILPGLIDAHVHAAGLWKRAVESGEVRGAPTKPVFRGRGTGEGESDHVAAALGGVRSLGDLLDAGVTVARDVGSPGSVGYDLRAAVADGAIAGPRLLVAGPILCPTGGHGYHLGVEADGRDGVRRAVRGLFKNGSDFIKLTASGGGGTAGTDMGRPTFSVEELRAAVQETTQRGSYVTAHCHSTEAITRCLDAGIPMLEHATFFDHERRVSFDPDVAGRIRDQGVVVSPTLAVHGRSLERVSGALAEMDPEQRAYWEWVANGFEKRMEIVARLYELGVTLIVGSDAPARGVEYGDFSYGIVLHVRAGVPPLDAIRSATSVTAGVLGIDDVTGSLAAGMDADVIAVDDNPITDIENIQRVALVMQRGDVRKLPAVDSSS